jgi:hypothetical protein
VISTIIFSKDRACQLDFLLTSLIENDGGIFDINILYDYSDDRFKTGYEKLSKKYPSLIWTEESDFQEDTINLVKKGGDLVCFFVDDNILYKEIEVDHDSITELFDKEDIFCLSLRLGANTIIQNEYLDRPCVLPEKATLINDTYLVWNWRSLPPYTNFAYPFSVDGHILAKDLVLNVLSNYTFDTPNALEGRALPHISDFSENMSSLKKSVLVNTPLNLVGSSENKSGQKFGVSLEELNSFYLSGNSPSLKDMDFSTVRGCHQEIQLKFKEEITNVRSI